jgi:predicted ester cyclase
VTSDKLTEFAKRYAQAWCSHDPERVAAFFGESASLKVNDDAPAIGRMAIAEIARGFMHDFPDMIITFDRLEPCADRTAFHWTLIGTNTGPGGTGKSVQVSGYELWKIGDDGLIAESKGHFDNAEYDRQLKHGIDD